jgi:sigma-B regulation protein RsbU (phosphoserine phosphatase)
VTADRSRRPTAEKIGRFGAFARDYAGGQSVADLRRRIDRDAAAAWKILTRDRPDEVEPTGAFRRWLYRAKVVFRGVSSRLSPPRRVLFLIALVAAVGAVSDSTIRFTYGETSVGIDVSGFWFFVCFGSLLYLLVVELVERALVRDELEIARAVQKELMPAGPPPVPGWSFACSYRTAAEVGGDAYDFLTLPDGRLSIAVADASGHGISAALVMAVASATLRTAVDIDAAPVPVAKLVHRALRRMATRRNLLTLFYARLDPEGGGLDWICAGHPYPLLRHVDGTLDEIGEGALPLGVRPEAAPAAGSARVAAGELLVLYTDGLVESLGADGTAFGHDRLRAAVAAGGGAAAVHERTLAAFREHLGAEPLSDDVSLLVAERLSA